MGVGGIAGRFVGRVRRQSGVSHEEYVEIPGEILVTGGRPAETHVGRIAGKKDVPDTPLLKKITQRRVAFFIVVYDVFRKNRDIFRDGNGQIPKPGIVESGA